MVVNLYKNWVRVYYWWEIKRIKLNIKEKSWCYFWFREEKRRLDWRWRVLWWSIVGEEDIWVGEEEIIVLEKIWG